MLFGSSWVVFSVFFAANRKSVDKEVFELVDSGDCVLVEKAETGEIPVEYVVGKDV